VAAVRCAGPLLFAVVVEITSKVTTAARTAREPSIASKMTAGSARADDRSRLTTGSQLRHDPGAVPIAGWPEFHRELLR
jgi:hypothetical protein